MQDPRISAALSVMMGINLMGDDEKMETESSYTSPEPKRECKKEPTPPPQNSEDDGLTEEQKEVFKNHELLLLKFSSV